MVKFGVCLPQVDVDYDIVKRVALECESVGFHSAWLTDHLLPILGQPQASYLECWTTLSALAEATTHIRLGTLVLCNLFRHPSVLAKMASTLDVISHGRLELGLGAGWFKPEFDAYGIPFREASIRIAMLQEALEVMKKMWSEEKPAFQGSYYSINGATCNPKPIQKPHPPIWVGTLIGGRRMFETIAKYADGWAIGSWYLPSIKEYKQKMESLKLYCLKAKREFESLEKALGVGCIIAENKTKLLEKIRKLKPAEVPIEKYETTQKLICGTPDECIEMLGTYVDIGVNHFTMDFPDITTLEAARLFGEHIIPYFK